MTIRCVVLRPGMWGALAVCVALGDGCSDGASSPREPDTTVVLRQVSGDGQISTAGSDLPSLLVVRVTNARGTPISGVSVDWATPDDDRLEPERPTSNDSGLVGAAWTLGGQAGHHAATATLGTQVVTFTATAAEPLSSGIVRHIRLATFDGSGEVVHPDVARVPSGWAPARRFLAITPYPGGDIDLEIPSIYESGDLAEWDVPAGVTNPIVKSGNGYLSDPDLVFEPDRRELWMYFRHVGELNSVLLTVSADGTHWNKPIRVVSAPNHELVSPAVVRISENSWHMWAVNAGPVGCISKSTTVEHRTSTDGLHWSAPQTVNVSGSGALPPWHIDVIWVPELEEFWALYNEKPPETCATTALRLSTSRDGITWTQHPTPVLHAGATPELHDIVYRSTLEYDGQTDMVTLWYSGARASGETWVWSAAVERRPRADLFRMIDLPEAAGRPGAPRRALQLTNPP